MQTPNVSALLEKHRVEIATIPYGESVSVRWLAEDPPSPHLAQLVATWREEQVVKIGGDASKMQRLENDLKPRRVGVTRLDRALHGHQQLYAWTAECKPISWAEHEIMQQKLLRDQLPLEERFRTLAVTLALITADDKIVLQKRSDKVSTYPNVWDGAAAGWVDCWFDPMGFLGNIHIDDEARRELAEEVGLRAEHITSLTLAGFCRHLTDYAITEANHVVRTRLTAAQVLEYAKGAVDRWEGTHRAFTREETLHLLETEEIKPAGAAALMLALNMV